MVYEETQLEGGGVIIEWVNPPPAPTHKTKGLDQTEFRSLFTPTEILINDECEAMINDLTYDTNGSVSLNDDAALVGMPGHTYRSVMRSCFRGFSSATIGGINMDHQFVLLSLNAQALLGLLDSPARKDVILLGKPL